MNSWSRRVLALMGAGLLSLSVALPAVAQTTVTGTVTADSALTTQFASNLNLGSVAYNPDVNSSLASADNQLMVDDDTGAPRNGWSVTMQITSSLGGGGGTGFNFDGGDYSDIPATSFSVASDSAVTKVGNPSQPIDATAGPKVQGGTLNNAVVVFSAGTGHGDGRYTSLLDFTLTVPQYSRPGSYAGTLTVSSNVGP